MSFTINRTVKFPACYLLLVVGLYAANDKYRDCETFINFLTRNNYHVYNIHQSTLDTAHLQECWMVNENLGQWISLSTPMAPVCVVNFYQQFL